MTKFPRNTCEEDILRPIGHVYRSDINKVAEIVGDRIPDSLALLQRTGIIDANILALVSEADADLFDILSQIALEQNDLLKGSKNKN